MSEAAANPLLSLKDLHMHFPVKGGVFLTAKASCRAVDGVSFDIMPGETVGLVGESGCGKSTLGKCIVRLLKPTSGEIHYDGINLGTIGRRRLKPLRREIQMIFQDPADSLNSRHTVRGILEEPFQIQKIGDSTSRQKKVDELLDVVGLPLSAADRFPFEFSGGQRQRIGIARAIALNPKLIICDEPVSALDVSIQSQILNLMLDLQEQFKLSYLFIAHDLAVVKHISDRIAVMYLGRVVEIADADTVYHNPRHPYTRALISAVPVPDPTRKRERIVLTGDVPSPINPPAGCPFHTRCPHVQDICRTEVPKLRNVAGDSERAHSVSCHFDL